MMRTKSAGGFKTRARRILFGVTTDQSLILLKGFPQHLVALDWDVHVVSSPGQNLDRLRKVPGLTVHDIAMAREPSMSLYDTSWPVRVSCRSSDSGLPTAWIPACRLSPPSQRSELRQRHFPDGPRAPIVVFIGRLTQDKGLDTLAGAMRPLTSEGRQGDCIVIGGDDGPASKNLRHQLDTSGWRVVHTGHIDGVTDVTQVMDILCLPSLREGFPNVVLEAAVLGIACVGSGATGVKDAIVHGDTGLIFERGDPASLVAQLRRILVSPDLALRLGMAARVHASKNYGRDDVWAVHSKFYSDLLDALATGGS